MHILVVTQYYAPEVGAAPTRLGATVAGFIDSGHEVTVLTSLPNHLNGATFGGYQGKIFHREVIDGVPVLRTWAFPAGGRGLKRLANYLSFMTTSALRGLGLSGVDLIFFESPPLFLGMAAVALKKRLGARLIMNVSDLWPDSVPAVAPESIFASKPLMEAGRALERFLYSQADVVTAVTKGILDGLKAKGLDADRLAYLPNGFDPDLFKPRPFRERSRRPMVFLVAGSHGYAHGLEVVVETSALLRHRSDVQIRLVGDGPTKGALQALAQRLGLSPKHLRFDAPVPLSSMPDVIAESSAHLVTLRNDPFFDRTRPARLLPSLACGRPAIVSGRGDVATEVAVHDCGQVVEPGNPAALASAIETYADDARLLRRQGKAAAKYAQAEMTWPVLVNRWLERVESRLEVEA
ncbi:MAG: hypothetical protein CMH58_05265 [Myxococcales bacterium]|nr:hypothetical protein [Myxococcales bacterium]